MARHPEKQNFSLCWERHSIMYLYGHHFEKLFSMSAFILDKKASKRKTSEVLKLLVKSQKATKTEYFQPLGHNN